MKVRWARWGIASLAVLGAGALAAWGLSGDGLSDDEDPHLATVRLGLAGSDFTEGSVRIIGTRASKKSRDPCVNGFDRCFNLTGTHPAVVLDNLCPSAEVAGDAWTFEYRLYSEPCAPDGSVGNGIVLNGTDAANSDLQCYDTQDLPSALHPNQSFAPVVDAGLNQRSIACLTADAERDVVLSACAQTSALDPGCTVAGSGCARVMGTPVGGRSRRPVRADASRRDGADLL